MSKSDRIEHEGVVIDVNHNFVSVEIIRQSACSSCGAKGMCSAANSQNSVIQVPANGFELYKNGEKVKVVMKQSLGLKALWISYIIPLIILLILLLLLSTFKISEILIGLSIICALALYFLTIYLLRDNFKKEFVFTIEKLDE
ncbi:MAG TPA: SoxR reducing system RseC family protein [Bacteroidales bacterium]|nr:SoxR reducing system RseC family protein [Bacteroidales bacterium]HRT33291.1 SoxR reducing system RseC family protein [Bacteroidales bacterium]HRT83774.1 SoxR reducing system RseC family protein [Bacteroidales bacterium]